MRYKIRYKIKYEIRYKKGNCPGIPGGTAGSRLGEPSGLGPPYLPFKKLSKNPLDILMGYLVREQVRGSKQESARERQKAGSRVQKSPKSASRSFLRAISVAGPRET